MNDLNSQSHNINQLEMANLINDADPSADQTSRLENVTFFYSQTLNNSKQIFKKN